MLSILAQVRVLRTKSLRDWHTWTGLSAHSGKRWKDNDGRIYEWDSRHGTMEKYDGTGKHLGEFDAGTGAQLKGPNAARRIKP